jgi:hypothetical protein
MYTKEQLLEKIDSKSIADTDKLIGCLRLWRIDPIYEDEKNAEYYDDLAVSRLNHGIRLREMGRNDNEISSIINNELTAPLNTPAVKKVYIKTRPNHPSSSLNKFTLDITSETLSILAESIAQKITDEIAEKFKENNVFEPVADSAKLKRDNEILSTQVERLLEENKKLITRNNLLQKENARFRHMFGIWYIKQN